MIDAEAGGGKLTAIGEEDAHLFSGGRCDVGGRDDEAIGSHDDAGTRPLSDHDGDSGGNEVGSKFFEGAVEFLGSLSQCQRERKEKGQEKFHGLKLAGVCEEALESGADFPGCESEGFPG